MPRGAFLNSIIYGRERPSISRSNSLQRSALTRCDVGIVRLMVKNMRPMRKIFYVIGALILGMCFTACPKNGGGGVSNPCQIAGSAGCACSPNNTCANRDLVCLQNTCVECGGFSQPCCAGNTCSEGNTCQFSSAQNSFSCVH